MSTQPLVLVADDEPRITKLVSIALGEEGFRVVTANGGEEALQKAEEVRPDIVLLDIVMPDLDGIEVMRQLRERRPVAVILLTAKGSTADKAKGLDLGADDYIAKPFDLRELRARLRSVLRRTRAGAAAPAPERAAAKRVRIGHCELDLATHQLFDADGGEISITSTDFDLLRVFAENANRVLSRDQLLTMTSNREWEPFDRAIDIRIARLRRKIEPDPENPAVIRTVRGAGYMFVSNGVTGS